jgi:hypothetical protein
MSRMLSSRTAFISKQAGPVYEALYGTSSTILISSIAALCLRLYLLPSTQSLPPFDPPDEIAEKRVIFECLSLDEARSISKSQHDLGGLTIEEENREDGIRDGQGQGQVQGQELVGMVNRCWKGKCRGRWKPARARHCSDCGVCRAGFDHHCPFVSRQHAQYEGQLALELQFIMHTALISGSLPIA